VVCGQEIPIKVNPSLSPAVTHRPVTSPPIGQNTSICYRYVGCFDTYPPFDNTGGVLPNPPERVGTVFLLYSPKSKLVGKPLLSFGDLITYNLITYSSGLSCSSGFVSLLILPT